MNEIITDNGKGYFVHCRKDDSDRSEALCGCGKSGHEWSAISADYFETYDQALKFAKNMVIC
ncbi:MAG: hypothetical protein DWQ19_10250 [Crenarchaeota archaeon]|nr:MAG: hypothetical protein DWQ19_10250 [Thermoproteota archaeon]